MNYFLEITTGKHGRVKAVIMVIMIWLWPIGIIYLCEYLLIKRAGIKRRGVMSVIIRTAGGMLLLTGITYLVRIAGIMPSWASFGESAYYVLLIGAAVLGIIYFIMLSIILSIDFSKNVRMVYKEGKKTEGQLKDNRNTTFSQPETSAEDEVRKARTRVIQCPYCGAANDVIEDVISKCDYCDSPITY